MLNIKLISSIYAGGGEYRLHTDDGKPSIHVLHNFFMAHAVDDAGNDYDVYWEISNRAAFDAEDDNNACDWAHPVEIYSWHDHKPVTVIGHTQWRFTVNVGN